MSLDIYDDNNVMKQTFVQTSCRKGQNCTHFFTIVWLEIYSNDFRRIHALATWHIHTYCPQRKYGYSVELGFTTNP